jgi:hypothetical protein
MIEILLLLIIILLVPWLLDVVVILGLISIGTILVIFTILGLVILYGYYPELISRITIGIFVLFLIINFIKNVIDNYSSKD